MSKKECHIHGLTEFRNGRNKCKLCESEYRRNKNRIRKKLLVEYKGNCCENCGYGKFLEVLEFHHINPKKKEFTISGNGRNVSLEIMKKEVDKCLLLCANCHREAHILGIDYEKDTSSTTA